MLAIALLIIGIIGFARGRIGVTPRRELRGRGLYTVATLFCLPLPMAFLSGLVAGLVATSTGRQVDEGTLARFALAVTWGPIVLAFILAFALAKPKLPPAQSAPRGFEVKM